MLEAVMTRSESSAKPSGPQGQATEHKRGTDWQPVPCEYDPNILKRIGTCKPEGELTIIDDH